MGPNGGMSSGGPGGYGPGQGGGYGGSEGYAPQGYGSGQRGRFQSQMEHRAVMEQRLQNIEKLLEQLVAKEANKDATPQ
jgi:hypothetical protein